MKELTFYPPNGVVFVVDLSNEDLEIPQYTEGQVAVANESCVFVAARADVDGDVTVKLSGSRSDTEGSSYLRVFDGSIRTPSRKVAIITAELEKILEIEVEEEKTHVTIWVDDTSYPSVISVIAV